MNYSQKIAKLEKKLEPIILAIESSCDETCASILKGGRKVIANQIISSAQIHKKYGGVVPEIASRYHTDAIDKVVKNALNEASLSFNDIDAIAVTYGAGLLGALLVGLSYAKALAFSLGVPLIAVNHIRGHLAAAYLADEKLEPPFISLLVSGGHTAIIKVDDYDNFTLLGSTLDDAVGEAFDKVARVLGLSYPGGPSVENLAKQGENIIVLPKMLKGAGGYNFSYSGLKTAVVNYVHNAEQKGEEVNNANLAKSFQCSAIDVLCEKAVEACLEHNLTTLTVGGGVGANGYLRETLTKKCANKSIKLVLPEKSMCTDNGAMIGAEGYIRYLQGDFSNLDLNAKANLHLKWKIINE